jgi:hypothetical protein
MGFLDKAKAAAETAATKAKDGVQEMQTKRELTSTYEELGKAAYDLVESGAIENETLAPQVAKINELKAQLDALKEPAAV